MNLFRLGASVLAILAVSACTTVSDDEDTDTTRQDEFIVELSPTSFWDGETFPPAGFCTLKGGLGRTPAFVIKHAPVGTNAILVEIDNLSIDGLDVGGGLGTYGYVYLGNNDEEVVLLPIQGNRSDLPHPAFLEKSHRMPNTKPAAYLPPCPMYNFKQEIQATLKAVKRTGTFENQKTEVLDTVTIPLGVLDD